MWGTVDQKRIDAARLVLLARTCSFWDEFEKAVEFGSFAFLTDDTARAMRDEVQSYVMAALKQDEGDPLRRLFSKGELLRRLGRFRQSLSILASCEAALGVRLRLASSRASKQELLATRFRDPVSDGGDDRLEENEKRHLQYDELQRRKHAVQNWQEAQAALDRICELTRSEISSFEPGVETWPTVLGEAPIWWSIGSLWDKRESRD
jgi:hypothetical protein